MTSKDASAGLSGKNPPYSWSAQEAAQLVLGYDRGLSLDDLSVFAGRSPHHVVVQLAWELCGVGRWDVNPLAPRFREPWSEEEHRALVHWHGSGVSSADIAHQLQRDVTDVAWRLVTERECRIRVRRAG
jgi:hypothetical protein